MPQITVDYSTSLDMTDSFDQEGFARALHETVVEIAAARPQACKTLFRSGSTAFAYADLEREPHAVVHVTVGLLAGRTEETKAKLTETVVELLRKHIEPVDGGLHLSAEVRDLDASYRKFEA
ncbi:5-carboxymethyl-2-hydroxymuconate Delta-isomerase [Streptomyces sp. NPDC093094]|uniref:5-carboxymethyl-2-hydroxymuconate Delta-isomerase n=1 Tax=Streptomyces sp. NPDC093094 TaxID=3366026 RepID=UPI00381C27AC